MKIKFAFLLLMTFIYHAQTFAFDPRLKPCQAKEQFSSPEIPDSQYIVYVGGHTFRKKDTCLPVTMLVTWKNEYKSRPDEWWKITYNHGISGEIWINHDAREFALVTGATTYQGYDKLQILEASGQYCKKRDGNACKELINYKKEDLRIDQAPLPAGPVNYGGYFLGRPSVTNANGEEVPEFLAMTQVGLRFEKGEDFWRFDPVNFDNLTFSKLIYDDIIMAISRRISIHEIYEYNGNEEIGEISKNKGLASFQLSLGCPITGDFRITTPQYGENLIFRGDSVGMLTIPSTAFIEHFPPELYEIRWSFPAKAGSQLTVTPSTGPEVLGLYNGLPDKNSDFGPTVITATADFGGHCPTMQTYQSVNVFFERDAHSKNIDEPNWFHYWLQTSAASLRGAGLGILFTSYKPQHPLCSNRDRQAFATMNPGTSMGDQVLKMSPEVVFCDLNNASAPHSYLPTDISRGVSWFIDAFAHLMGREIYRISHWNSWWPNGYPLTFNSLPLTDADFDHIPDSLEPNLQYNPTIMNSLLFRAGQFEYDDSDHYFSKRSESTWVKGSADREDWSCPGTQCDD